jgi:hypothetical protein
VTDALPISRFPVPHLADMPEDICNRILTVQEKSGCIPNVFLVLAHRPGRVPGLLRLPRRADGEVGKPDQGRARDDRCRDLKRKPVPILRHRPRGDPAYQYCVIAHGAILRIRAKNPLIADQVAINYRKADTTERQKAMLDLALKVSRSAETVGEADFDVLKSHGFDEEDIWDIAGIAAFFGLSNRMANVTAMRPNSEFYTMGRS